MSTPDTVGPMGRITTPSYNHELATVRAGVRRRTASTVRRSYDASIVVLALESTDGTDHRQGLSTFDMCSRTVISAAERMVSLVREPQSLAVAIAYDECLDIITAAVNQMEETGPQGVMHEHVLEVYQAMRSIHEVLRPSSSVRRALQF
ncbi:unnamed protein product [Peronospora belbahrii]|uniref:Uncharacterized protein n=1 Tax=Peronospora belbahrii TaxID=622444 RepID=A0AAU9L9W2_9STRA|nr:unnamed protein product [Peronospora belbahrii]CAH0517691.1 unnamed protein product [Peronospora belbahrii]